MKNHSFVHNEKDLVLNGIYHIEPFSKEVDGIFSNDEKEDKFRSWYFYPISVNGHFLLIDTCETKGIQVTEEMLKRDVVEFVCDSSMYQDIGSDPCKVENYDRMDYEIVVLRDGSTHYLLRNDAQENPMLKLYNLIDKRNRCLYELEAIERNLLASLKIGDQVYYPDPDKCLWAFSQKDAVNHQKTFMEAFHKNLPVINLQEWISLEDFLEISLSYEQYMRLVHFCNDDSEIDGNILDLSNSFKHRKKDLFTIAREAERRI